MIKNKEEIFNRAIDIERYYRQYGELNNPVVEKDLDYVQSILDKKYRRDKLPKSEADWDRVDENGVATTKNSGMWDLCKLCQVSAKTPMNEKDYGRPISVSYRKALGLEGDKKDLADYVVDGHKKKLAPNLGFRDEDSKS